MTRLTHNGKVLQMNGSSIVIPSSSGYQVELIVTMGPDIESEGGGFSVNGDEKIWFVGTAEESDSVIVTYQLGDVTNIDYSSTSFDILIDGVPPEGPGDFAPLDSYDGSFSTLEIILTNSGGGQT